MEVTSPDGVPIIGTNDIVPAIGLIKSFSIEFGTLQFEYAGESDIQWDKQYTITNDGQLSYVDEHGNVWAEWQLLIDGKPIIDALVSELRGEDSNA